MNWKHLRHFPWLDARSRFVAGAPRGGKLLDLGSSDGQTLRHMAELRPDLQFHAVDKQGQPANYPSGCRFERADLERERLPWPDHSMDAVTCMQVIEHLHDLDVLIREIARLLKKGGRVFFETPHLKTLTLPSASGAGAGLFTLNFFDDADHVQPVAMEALAERVRQAGLEVLATGTSRNWLLAGCWPVFMWLPPSREKFTAKAHWIGWSVYLIAGFPN